MTRADGSNSTLMRAVSTRRRFLSTAVGIAAGSTALALADPALAAANDPVFAAIKAFRVTADAHIAALDEQNRLEVAGDPRADDVSEQPCYAEMAAFNALITTTPVTLSGLAALLAFLNDLVVQGEGWRFEGQADATILIATLAESVCKLAVQSG